MEFRAWLSLHKRPNSPQIPANLNSYSRLTLFGQLLLHANSTNHTAIDGKLNMTSQRTRRILVRATYETR